MYKGVFFIKREYRKYSEEFKSHIISLYKIGKSQFEILQEYDLSASTFNSWIKKYENGELFTVKRKQNTLLKLCDELKRLRMENEVLKKAILIIGKNENGSCRSNSF